jgi:predicted nucleotidyltransferase
MTAPVTVARLRNLVAEAPSGVVAVYIFGSVARGTASTDSDVDLGLLLDSPPAPTLEGRMLDCETALERELGRKVQGPPPKYG